MTVTLHAEFISFEHGINGYTIYVFKNLDNPEWFNKYIMCVRFPNWDHRGIELNERGFLTYKENIAGESYYDSTLQENNLYKYNSLQFIKFLKEIDTKKVDKFIM